MNLSPVRWITVFAAMVSFATIASQSHAQGTTFADFLQVSQSDLLFAKSNANFITSTNGTTVTSIPVLFRFDVANGYGAANTFINATLTMTGTFAGNVMMGSGSLATQQVTNYTAIFTANTPGNNGSTNLLTITAGTSTFSGDGGSGGFQAATTGGDSVVYSSAALSFSSTSDRNFSYALTSITPAIPGSGAIANNAIPDFRASAAGQFSSSVLPVATAAPEPSSVTMAGLGLLGMAAGVIRRSRKRS